MTTDAARVVAELQAVLSRSRAALFFGPDHEAELWIDGSCAGHITHDDNCELVEGTICEAGSN